MDKQISIEKNDKTGRWQSTTNKSGMCFTISLDRMEQILKTGVLPDAFPNWKLKPEEYVERFTFDNNGITVYIGNRSLR